MRLATVVLLFLSACAGAQTSNLPDAPQPAPSVQHVHFYTWRTDYRKPALRTNKQMLKDPIFWIGEAGHWAAMIAAIRDKTSNEQAHSEIPATAALTVVDFAFAKYFSETISTGSQIFATVKYSINASH